jgi:hypothetical protein
LLCRHHFFELEILFYDSYRFLNRDYISFDCGGMAFSQAGFHASVTIGQLRASSLEQNREGHEFHSCRFGLTKKMRLQPPLRPSVGL